MHKHVSIIQQDSAASFPVETPSLQFLHATLSNLMCHEKVLSAFLKSALFSLLKGGGGS